MSISHWSRHSKGDCKKKLYFTWVAKARKWTFDRETWSAGISLNSTEYSVQNNFKKQKTFTSLSMLADGKKTGLPASFMVSQSWKGSLHEKKERFLKKLDSSCHRKLFDQLYQCELWYVKSVVMTAYV